jgi:hypothetical protein
METGLLFPLTPPLSPDSGGEGGVKGDFHGPFYATFNSIFVLKSICSTLGGRAFYFAIPNLTFYEIIK